MYCGNDLELCISQVNIGLRVLTRPVPGKLPEIYRTLGTDYGERVLPSIIQVLLQSPMTSFRTEVSYACECFSVYATHPGRLGLGTVH